MASSIDNAFITQYGRRKPKMPQKRTRPPKRKPISVPSHEELMEGRKRIKPKRKPISVPSHEELMEGRKRIKPKPKAKPKPPKRRKKEKTKNA